MTKNRSKRWLRIFWVFFKSFSLSTSGPAAIGLVYEEVVGDLLDERRFVEAVGFSNALPGGEAIKLALLVGYASGGVGGMLAALTGALFPPVAMVVLALWMLEPLRQAGWLTGFLHGLTPTLAAMVAVVGWKIFHSLPTKRTGHWALALISLAALWLGVPSPMVLILAGLAGLVMYR